MPSWGLYFLLLRTLEFEKDLKYTADKLHVSYRMEIKQSSMLKTHPFWLRTARPLLSWQVCSCSAAALSSPCDITIAWRKVFRSFPFSTHAQAFPLDHTHTRTCACTHTHTCRKHFALVVWVWFLLCKQGAQGNRHNDSQCKYERSPHQVPVWELIKSSWWWGKLRTAPDEALTTCNELLMSEF